MPRLDENEGEVQLEIYLPLGWFVQGVYGTSDIGGADILHRWRW